jgi:hypothetical protein
VRLSVIRSLGKGDLTKPSVGLERFVRTARVLNDIKRWQESPHNFQSHPNIMSIVGNSLECSRIYVEGNCDRLYELSMETERKNIDDDRRNMERLLEESGFL